MTTFCNTVTPSIPGTFPSPTGTPVGNNWPTTPFNTGFGYTPTTNPYIGGIPGTFPGSFPGVNNVPCFTNGFPTNCIPGCGTYPAYGQQNYGVTTPWNTTPWNTTPWNTTPWATTPWNCIPQTMNTVPFQTPVCGPVPFTNTIPFGGMNTFNQVTPWNAFNRPFGPFGTNTLPWNNLYNTGCLPFGCTPTIPGACFGTDCTPGIGNINSLYNHPVFNNGVNTFGVNPINTPWNTGFGFPQNTVNPFLGTINQPWTTPTNGFPWSPNWTTPVNNFCNPFTNTCTPFGTIPAFNPTLGTPWGSVPTTPFTNSFPFTAPFNTTPFNTVNPFTPVNAFNTFPPFSPFNTFPNTFSPTSTFGFGGQTLPFSNTTPTFPFAFNPTLNPTLNTPVCNPFTNTCTPFTNIWNPYATNSSPFNTFNPYGQIPFTGMPNQFIPGMTPPFTNPQQVNPVTGVPMNMGGGGPVGMPYGQRPSDNGDANFPMRNVA